MAYQYPLSGGRINASIAGNITSAGAGYQLVSTGTIVLAGGNNVTLSQNANSISIAGPTLSNSNGFTFGTNGSIVTASFAGGGGGSINFSAGTTSGNLASVEFANSNGVSFGLNAGTITGTVATNYAASNHSHGNPTLNLTNISGTTASASNGLTLSLSANSQSLQTQDRFNLTLTGNTAGVMAQVSSGTLSLAGGNNITLSQDGNAVTISGASQSAQTQSNIQGIIASGSTNRTGDISFANSNGVTFGLSNNTVTASVAGGAQSAQTIGGYATGNTTGQSSSSTMDARSVSLNALGGISAGFSGGMLQMSAPDISSLSYTGAVSISRNGNTISIGAPAYVSYSSTVLGNQSPGNTATSSLAQNSLYIFPQIIDQYVTGSMIKIPVEVTNSSSAFAAHTRGYTANFGVYSRHATNSTVLTRMYSTSYTAGFSANSNGTWAISVITGLANSTSYNSTTASSAGLNLSGYVHGTRELLIGFVSSLVPGEYWFGFQNSSSSDGAAGNLFNVGHYVNTTASGNALGVTQNATNVGIGRSIGHGTYSATTGAMPAGISLTQINQYGVNPIMYFMAGTA